MKTKWKIDLEEGTSIPGTDKKAILDDAKILKKCNPYSSLGGGHKVLQLIGYMQCDDTTRKRMCVIVYMWKLSWHGKKMCGMSWGWYNMVKCGKSCSLYMAPLLAESQCP